MEVESALVDHPKVAEAAVVGKTHEIKGQAVAAFVTVKEGVKANDALVDELKEHVVRKIGALARPGPDSVRRRPAEDAIGQDHAPAAARHRRRQGAGRHDDAGRPERGRKAEGRVRGAGVSSACGHASACEPALSPHVRRVFELEVTLCP